MRKQFFRTIEQKGNHTRGFLLWGILTISCLMLTASANAQSISRVGTTAAPFLKLGVGARALGMGEAYTTQAEDASAAYWNPAGLANMSKNEVIINHFDYIADIYFDYAGIAIPVEGLGTFGASVSRLGMPDIERTTEMFPNGNGEKVSAGSFMFGVSYAKALTDRFAFGANIKYINENIWHSSASSFAFDVGILYKTMFRNLRIGMSISNFGGDMQMDGRDLAIQHDVRPGFEGNDPNIPGSLETDKFPLPMVFRVGVSANIAEDFFSMTDYDWIVSVDAVHPNDNNEYLNLGTEVRLFDMVSLRAGFRELLLTEREGGLTFGFGLQQTFMNMDFRLDYANVDYGRLDHQNKFSLSLSF